MKPDTSKIPNLCDHHLEDLYLAIQRGDANKVYELEHILNQTEKCVACSYVFKAQGGTKAVLEQLLSQEGFIKIKWRSEKEKIRYWFTRMLMLGLLFVVFSCAAIVIKRLLYSPAAPLKMSSFGAMAALVLSIAVFILLESWLFED